MEDPVLAPAPVVTPSYINPEYEDIEYWGQWAIQNGYNLDDYVYSEGNSTGIDGEIGNEFVCIRDDTNQVIIGRPDVCGTYYNGLGYDFANITTDPTNLTSAPDIIDAVTGNLVDPNLANWGGCNYTGQNLGGTHHINRGPVPNCGQDIINWSYQQYWVYRRHAIEQALQQAGVNVDGYQWEFTIKNNNADSSQGGVDNMQIVMRIWDKSGNEVHTKNWYYNTRFNWTTFSGTELFANPLVGENLQSWQLQMKGHDTGYWAGFYGPEMLTPEIRMIYSSNPCAIDPLLHPDCDGYVQAYTEYVYDQNCTANPLYDSGCPGYQQAYFNQQCNANALYDPSCPGYQEAYYDQQCSYNPLYDAGCPGYQQAYYDQQCSADPLYDSGCPGYQTAYYNQQCSADALYDSGCPGYESAYYDQQCSIDPLYDSGCTGYAQAFYDQQCGINPLYDSGCPGYEQAYYDQQCGINGLYDAGCPNYETAYFDYQCRLDALYSTECTGYADAYYSLQCSLDALYDSQCPGYADAYYDQQCGLDALYDSGCPGYESAYFAEFVKPELDKQAEQAAGVDNSQAVDTVANSTLTDSDPVAALTETPATGDATVDQVLRETANVSTTIGVAGVDTSTPAAGPTVQTNTPDGSGTQSSSTSESSPEEQMEAELVASLDEGSTDEEVSESSDNVDESSEEESDNGDSESGESDSSDSTENEGEGKSDSKKEMTEKQKAEAKRKKIKEIATQRAMMLADTMSQAASLEAQQAIQAQIAALINFVPGFNAYGQAAIPGRDFYASEDIYQDKEVPENRRGLRNGLAQQLLHEKMVEQQYEINND